MSKIQDDQINDLDADLREQLKELTIARIQTISKDARISLGSEDYSSEDLITHLEGNDAIGDELIQMNWQYLKDLASGALYDNE